MDECSLGATGKLIDSIGLLTPTERSQLQASLGSVLADCQAEFIVYIVDAVTGRSFREHAMASRRTFAKDQSTSIILVIAVKDRHAEIATSPQFSDRFTPSASTELLKAEMVPLMRRGQTAKAIVSAVSAMRELLRRIDGHDSEPSAWTARSRPLQTLPKPSRRVGFLALLTLVLTTFMSILILGPIRSFRQEHTCRECGKWCSITSKDLKHPTHSETGLRQRDYACTKCGAKYTRKVVLPVLTQSSSDSSSWSSDSSSSSSDSSSGGSDSGGSDGGGGADW